MLKEKLLSMKLQLNYKERKRERHLSPLSFPLRHTTRLYTIGDLSISVSRSFSPSKGRQISKGVDIYRRWERRCVLIRKRYTCTYICTYIIIIYMYTCVWQNYVHIYESQFALCCSLSSSRVLSAVGSARALTRKRKREKERMYVWSYRWLNALILFLPYW